MYTYEYSTVDGDSYLSLNVWIPSAYVLGRVRQNGPVGHLTSNLPDTPTVALL